MIKSIKKLFFVTVLFCSTQLQSFIVDGYFDPVNIALVTGKEVVRENSLGRISPYSSYKDYFPKKYFLPQCYDEKIKRMTGHAADFVVELVQEDYYLSDLRYLAAIVDDGLIAKIYSATFFNCVEESFFSDENITRTLMLIRYLPHLFSDQYGEINILPDTFITCEDSEMSTRKLEVIFNLLIEAKFNELMLPHGFEAQNTIIQKLFEKIEQGKILVESLVNFIGEVKIEMTNYQNLLRNNFSNDRFTQDQLMLSRLDELLFGLDDL